MNNEQYKALSAYYLETTENELERIKTEASSIFPSLREAMFYSVSAGGKRIRPCLALAVCQMLGGKTETVLPIACALELIHTYSLIHDDLPCMDDDDMRRGRPSNHKVYGEAMAVLAGDGLLSLAFEIMLKGIASVDPADREGYLRAVNEAALRAGASGMVSGQAADIETEGSGKTSADMLEYIHTHKTADMLCAAVLSGAMAAGADDAAIDKLGVYAESIGLLFQITDDILDVSGDESAVGKTLGKDNIENKLTFVSLYGLEGALKAAENAAARAREAIIDLPDNGYLMHTIDSILYRSH